MNNSLFIKLSIINNIIPSNFFNSKNILFDVVCGYILICLVCYRVELAGIRPQDLEGLSPGEDGSY